MEIPNILERDLLIKLRDGNHQAFSKIYDQYSASITLHLTKLLKSEDLAFEVAQDTFVTVWERRANLDPTQSLKSYLYKIATNKSLKIFRKASHDQAYRAHLLPIIERGYAHIDNFISQKENQEILEVLLKDMPEKQREVYHLHKIEGYTYKEISEQLGLAIGTINAHMNKANHHIKTQILKRPHLLSVLLFTVIL